MADDEQERSRKPRQMIHRAQAQVLDDIYKLHAARSTEDEQALAAAQQKLHASTMVYWRTLYRYHDHDSVRDLWTEPLGVGDDISLNDVRQLRLAEDVEHVERYDPDLATERRERRTRNWTMSPALALAINDQLDLCAAELGFAAPPEEETPEVYPEPV